MAKQVSGAPLALAIVGLMANVAWAAEGGTKGTVYGAGTVTCGEWRQHRSTGNKAAELQLQAWIDGFLSGYNFGSDLFDFLAPSPERTAVAYYAWIDNYCSQNPLNRVADAAAALKNELISRKLP
jgi:hypothetical protein